MGLLSSLARTEVAVPLAPAQASVRLVQVLSEHGFALDDASHAGGTELGFESPLQGFRNALTGAARITANGSGSLVELTLDVAPGQSYAVLDGRRNRSTLAQIVAALPEQE